MVLKGFTMGSQPRQPNHPAAGNDGVERIAREDSRIRLVSAIIVGHGYADRRTLIA